MSRRVGRIDPRACIGEPAECREDEPDAGTYIAPSATIEAFATIDSGTARMTRVDHDAWIFKHAHIAHDAHIMEGAEVSTGAVIGGWCVVGPGAKIGLNATLRPKVVVGQRARIGAGAVVTKNVPPGETWVGNPARRLVAKPKPLGEFIPPRWWAEAMGATEAELSRLYPQARPAPTTTSPATNTPSCGPVTSSPAIAADEAAAARLASQATSKKPTTPAPARASLDGFTVPWAPHVASPVDWGY